MKTSWIPLRIQLTKPKTRLNTKPPPSYYPPLPSPLEKVTIQSLLELRPSALAIISSIWVRSSPFGINTYLLDPLLFFYPIAHCSSWDLEFVCRFLLSWLPGFALVRERDLVMFEIGENMNLLPVTVCSLYTLNGLDASLVQYPFAN